MKKTVSNPGQISMFVESILDSFAGGGGASVGIEIATGRVVDYAINHNADAIKMHEINHPFTKHYQSDIWEIEPEDVCEGRPVGLAWFSPDCKHFSKAKGAPLVDHKIRGLSWVVIKWCLKARPRVILMENVEEITTWGPLIPVLDPKTGRPMKTKTYLRNGKERNKIVVSAPGEIIPDNQRVMMPDPKRKGETFNGFIAILTTGISPDHPAFLECCEFLGLSPDSADAQKLAHGLGYDVDHRELVAADFGAPTSRRRFILEARCDGRPIAWPEPTHGRPGSPEVLSGKRLPWRSAADIIDWSLPCPSIFEDKKTIKKKYGLSAQRPLAENTMRRIIRGTDKFTIRSGRPFLVPTGYGEREGQAPRVHSADAPLPTVVSTGKQCLCQPMMAPYTVTNTSNSVGAPADHPVHTVTSAGNQMLVEPILAPFSVECNHSGDGHVSDLIEPCKTITAKYTGGIAAASLMQYHTERPGEEARMSVPDGPLATVDGSNRHGLTLAHLTEFYGNGQPLDVRGPLHTVTSRDRDALTLCHLDKYYAGGYKCAGNRADEPLSTITAEPRHSLVAAHVQKYYGGVVGSDAANPLPTVTAIDHNSLVAAHIAEFKGKDIGQSAEKPLRTITASAGEFAAVKTKIVRYEPGTDLNHWPEIRALLNKHCGYSLADNEIILLQIFGAWYFISDIGLRMLIPEELYAAMGFPRDYIINFVDPVTGKDYPKSAKVERCGNAVSPPVATAMVRAALPEWCEHRIETMAEFRKLVAV